MNRRTHHRSPRWQRLLKGATTALAGGARWLGNLRAPTGLLGRGRNRRVTSSVRTSKAGERPGLRHVIASLAIGLWMRRGAAWVLPLVMLGVGFSAPVLGVKAYRYVMQTGHFYVTDVLVDGNERLTFEEIREITGLQPNTHLLATDLGQFAARLRQHPWVATARVQRELPDRLIIRITEHEPVAYVALGALWLVNQSGEPFTEVRPDLDLDLPMITGIDAATMASPERSTDAKARIRGAVGLARLYRKAGMGNRWPLGEVRVEAAGRFSLVLSQHGTEVALGTAPYRQKLYKLEWVLENLHRQEQTADYILLDLSKDGHDDGRVIVKADIGMSASDKAREASHFARPSGPLAEPPRIAPSPRKKHLKKKRRRDRRRKMKKRRQHILPGPVPSHAGQGRGA